MASLIRTVMKINELNQLNRGGSESRILSTPTLDLFIIVIDKHMNFIVKSTPLLSLSKLEERTCRRLKTIVLLLPSNITCLVVLN